MHVFSLEQKQLLYIHEVNIRRCADDVTVTDGHVGDQLTDFMDIHGEGELQKSRVLPSFQRG